MPVDPTDAGTDSRVVDTTSGSSHDFENFPVLEIDGQIPGGGDHTSQFVFTADAEVTEEVNPNALLEGVLGNLNGVFTQFFEALSEAGDPNVNAQRRGIWFDLGAGSHDIQLRYIAPEGSQFDLDDDGTQEEVYWGNTEDGSTLSQGNATGATALQQQQVLNAYLATSTIGSFSHARLYYGEYSPTGSRPEDYYPVAVTRSEGLRTAETHNQFDGSIDFTAVQQLSEEIDASIEGLFNPGDTSAYR